MNIRRLLHGAAIACTVILTHSVSPAFATPSPVSLVEEFHANLLASMKSANKTNTEQRYKILAPIIKEAFNSKLMIRVATGSYWRKATPQQQTTLIDTFLRFSTATYAAQFDGYSGQSFKILGQKPGLKKDILVQAQITNPQSDNVALTYVTRQNNGRWQIIDVLVDAGISNLARMRSEYRHTLKSKGIDGLIRLLKTKTDVLLSN